MSRPGKPAEVIGWSEGEKANPWYVCRYFLTPEEIKERAQLNGEVTASSLRQRALGKVPIKASIPFAEVVMRFSQV